MSGISPLTLIVLGLASWRLASLLVQEAGPWDVLARLRAVNDLGGALSCLWCASVWTAAGMLLCWTIGGLAQVFVVVLAISAAGLALASFTGLGVET